MDIRVAIFEDNKLVRDALQTILNGTSGFMCCGVFADGSRWETDINRSEPDVVLIPAVAIRSFAENGTPNSLGSGAPDRRCRIAARAASRACSAVTVMNAL